MATTTTKVMATVVLGLAVFLGVALLIIPVISIKNAWLLDNNRNVLNNVFDLVKSRDNNWTTIPKGYYLRVQFEKKLNKSNDITIYAKADNYTILKVYRKNLNTIIATFNISKEGYYRVDLTKLKTYTADTFDILATDTIKIDYVVDPFWNGSAYPVFTALVSPLTNTILDSILLT